MATPSASPPIAIANNSPRPGPSARGVLVPPLSPRQALCRIPTPRLPPSAAPATLHPPPHPAATTTSQLLQNPTPRHANATTATPPPPIQKPCHALPSYLLPLSPRNLSPRPNSFAAIAPNHRPPNHAAAATTASQFLPNPRRAARFPFPHPRPSLPFFCRAGGRSPSARLPRPVSPSRMPSFPGLRSFAGPSAEGLVEAGREKKRGAPNRVGAPRFPGKA